MSGKTYYTFYLLLKQKSTVCLHIVCYMSDKDSLVVKHEKKNVRKVGVMLKM